MKTTTLVILFPLFLSCQSSPTEVGASVEPGTITVVNIPDVYIGGVILVTGSNGTERFTYSPKVLQKVTGNAMGVRIYEQVGMIQKPFTKKGVFTVTVELYAPASENSADVRVKESEIREWKKRFYKGSTSVDWNKGLDIKYKISPSGTEIMADFVRPFVEPFFWDAKLNFNRL
ncbi:MAG: hypothetical protein LBE74_00300 [Treponema sp.]|jgi:hypothetical protein|nr:hypothetical protein [Treponema sp.]